MRFDEILQINLIISMIGIIAYNTILTYNTLCTTFMFPQLIMLNLDSMINYCLPTIRTIQSTMILYYIIIMDKKDRYQ